MLARDVDPHDIIDQLCQTIDNQTKAFERYVNNDTRPFIINNIQK